ncbi:MAG: hypothetical protein K2Q06_07650, partial [Parvularculaceae bacterium]|nr:hypothetical protein [Parvularculaceae bacterium]
RLARAFAADAALRAFRDGDDQKPDDAAAAPADVLADLKRLRETAEDFSAIARLHLFLAGAARTRAAASALRASAEAEMTAARLLEAAIAGLEAHARERRFDPQTDGGRR